MPKRIIITPKKINWGKTDPNIGKGTGERPDSHADTAGDRHGANVDNSGRGNDPDKADSAGKGKGGGN